MGWVVAAPGQTDNVGMRHSAIKRLLTYEPGSARWLEELEIAAGESGKHPRTLRRWAARYVENGLNGLANRRPSNAGQRRVHVSLKFDRAIRQQGLGDAILVAIGAEIDQKIKDILASRAEAAGIMDVKRRVEFELLKICEAKGIPVLPNALTISRRHIEKMDEFRQVNILRNDAKRFADGQPRISRDWTYLAPMAVVITDVKHVDVRLIRSDGTPAYPKLVCFKDGGTGRVWIKLLLLPVGEGIRQEHVIEAFIAMTCDPMWGFPSAVYMDNGKEFACLERLREAFSSLGSQTAPSVIKARAFNASAKTVESDFSALDTYLFSSLSGYAGSDRLKKKTQNVGREPLPFPGGFEAFEQLVAGLLKDFNARTGGEQWPDESPMQVFCRKVADWRPTLVDPLVLDASFCDRDDRRIDRGTLSIRSTSYHHPELDTLPHRTKIDIALPWRREAYPLARMPDGRWIALRPDHRFPALSLDGAREAAARQGRFRRAARSRAKQVRPYDPGVATLEMVARLPELEAPGWMRELRGDQDLRSMAAAQRQAAAEREAEPRLADIRVRREFNEAQRLEREIDVERFFSR